MLHTRRNLRPAPRRRARARHACVPCPYAGVPDPGATGRFLEICYGICISYTTLITFRDFVALGPCPCPWVATATALCAIAQYMYIAVWLPCAAPLRQPHSHKTQDSPAQAPASPGDWIDNSRACSLSADRDVQCVRRGLTKLVRCPATALGYCICALSCRQPPPAALCALL